MQHSGNGSTPSALPPSPPLSARQRDAQRVEIIEAINATARQVNFLTPALRSMRDEIASLRTQQGATFNSLAEFCGRSFWQRLRWVFTGR